VTLYATLAVSKPFWLNSLMPITRNNYVDGKVYTVFICNCFPKIKDFSRLGALQAVTHTVTVIVGLSKKWCERNRFCSSMLNYIKTGDLSSEFMNSNCYWKSSWWRGTVVERRSLTGELSLSCARPAADGWPLMWANRPLQVSQLGQLSLSSFLGR